MQTLVTGGTGMVGHSSWRRCSAAAIACALEAAVADLRLSARPDT